jgi:hypothetical protein
MHADDTQGNAMLMRKRHGLRPPGLLAIALAGTALLAACSSPPANSDPASRSSSATSASATSASASGLAYSQCMRAHGIKNFPDPNPSGGIGIGPSSGINPNSPQYQTAEQACHSLAAGGVSPAQQAQNYASELKYAHCMQTHGVPGFPEPPAPGNGPNSQSNSGSASQHNGSGSVDPNSPQFIAANKTCEHYLPAGQQGGTNNGGGA